MILITPDFNGTCKRTIAELIEQKNAGFHDGKLEIAGNKAQSAIETSGKMLELFFKKGLITKEELCEILGISTFEVEEYRS